MEKINFQNNITKANADTFNTLQTMIENAIEYKNGDIYQPVGSLPVVGFTTAGASTLAFTITLPKKINKIRRTIVNNCSIVARTTQGYLNDSSDWKDYSTDSDYTITNSKTSDNTIKVTIAKSTPFTNVANNTPVCVYVGPDFKLTFEE